MSASTEAGHAGGAPMGVVPPQPTPAAGQPAAGGFSRVIPAHQLQLAAVEREAGRSWAAIARDIGCDPHTLRKAVTGSSRGGAKIHWTAEIDASIVRMRLDGHDYAAIGEALGFGTDTIRKRWWEIRPAELRNRNHAAAMAAVAARNQAKKQPRVCLRCKYMRPDDPPESWMFLHLDPPRIRRMCDPCRTAAGGMA